MLGFFSFCDEYDEYFSQKYACFYIWCEKEKKIVKSDEILGHKL